MKAEVNRIRKYLDDTCQSSNSDGERGAPDEQAIPDSTFLLAHASGCDEFETESELADILDQYLEHLENGTPLGVDDLVARYPQFEQPLREYLAGLNLLNAGIAEMADSPFPCDGDDRQELGDYELIREIGRGGMGVVYEARQISLDRRVALKVLPFAAMLDQRQIVRFETEARAAARLQHPHIVPVYGVGCDRGVHYYAMQFVEGSSVRGLIDSAPKHNGVATVARRWTGLSSYIHALARAATPRRAAHLGVQAASALHAAHACGIVHRDIKPSNLLLDAKNDLWIADFGLARCQADNHVTRSGDVLGTLHYMSPEQARGNSSIADPRSDIYSLGVTLYELLTSERPFNGESHTDVLQQIELGHCKPIRTLNSEIPRDLENVIAKAMSVDPSHRYQSASELEADLLRFVEGRATLAKPPSKSQLLARWASRHRSFVASFMVALVVICLSLGFATFWLAGERAELAAKRELADDKLATTETTFEEFGMATAERLKNIPGSESARQALLADLLDHYEDLLRASENDPALREDRAITSMKIANVHRESGDLVRSLRAYRRAESDFRLLMETRRVSEVNALLAKCLSNISVVLLELGELDDAANEARHAIALQTKLLAKHRTATSLLDLAASYTNLASIEFERNETGRNRLEKAAELAEEARRVSSQSEQTDALNTLAMIYGRLSAQSRPTSMDNATEYAQQAVACSHELLASSEGCTQTDYRSLHALSCNNLASLFVEQNKNREAVELFTTAASQLEQIEDRERLVLTLCNLAKIQTRERDALAAAASYHKAITVQSSLLLGSPGNLNHVSRLGGLHNNLAFTLQQLGKNENACVAYESAIEYQHRAYQLAPKHLAYYRDALSRTLFNASQASMNVGRPHQAAELQLRRSELWPNDAKQLFSVAWSIAAAMDDVPVTDPQRDTWRRSARTILEAAADCDSSSALNAGRVAKLTHNLSRVVVRSGIRAERVRSMSDPSHGSQP